MTIYITPNENRSEIVNIFQKLSKSFEFRTLLVGDYAIGEFDSTGILDGIIIERKSAGDYIGSLLSGHLSTQLYEMSYNFPLSYLFIIGDLRTESREHNIPWNTILSSLIGSSFKRASDGVCGIVIPRTVDDDWDFVTSLICLEKKWINGETQRIPVMVKKSWSSDEYAIYILSSFPEIGSKTAKSLLRYFKSLKNIANASVNDLKNVNDIGNKKADIIYNLFNTERDI